MASGNEPVSVDNLAAVIQGMGLGREVLMAYPTKVDGYASFSYPNMAGKFSQVEVETEDSNTMKTYTCPVPGSVSIDEQYNNMYVSVSENGSTLDISFSQNLGSGQTVFRIVGIRSGGGVSPS